jgi:hypothetical protein
VCVCVCVCFLPLLPLSFTALRFIVSIKFYSDETDVKVYKITNVMISYCHRGNVIQYVGCADHGVFSSSVFRFTVLL